ncbi:MAG: methyltransferase domain-containing protein [Hyphomonas sp.]|nr:methyltransferase domain-containing protein [Hyphomonas sp.]HRX74876.1 methyltransferase domain-containing protein [Hyphomonas sp.]
MNQIQDIVKTYYGETLTGTKDLRTDACTTADRPAPHVSAALAAVHDEVAGRYYGCGLAIPSVLEGLKVLDLGCGAGRDVFALAKLVGPTGHVTGVDMTDAQLDVARAHEAWHAEKFGYAAPNTRFLKGYLEKLGDLDLEPGSFDLIISNCVINLCTDKPEVFRQAHRLLKPGGELYFSDVYADRRIPADLAADPVLYGECLSGALYWGDFLTIAKKSGFTDPRTVDHRRLGIIDPVLKDKLGPIRFASVTARLMRLDGLDTSCEDYGQAVIYKGGIPGMERTFILDAEHHIEAGRVFPVCGNTLSMLMDTRFAPWFEVVGEGKTHYGLFPGCAAPDVFASAAGEAGADAANCCSPSSSGSSCC